MKKLFFIMTAVLLFAVNQAQGAYHHGGDTDSDVVLQAYPAIAGTKLDSCALCHTGGEYEKKPGVIISMGSCQWCHHSYGYDQSGNIDDTLNSYGEDYKLNGRNLDGLQRLESSDSDGDGYSSGDEIAALRYPGNPDDDPTKVAAPFKVVSLDELEELGYHSQFMLMNTHKSGDFYAEYGGVPVAELLEYSSMLESATGITVYAPDGFSQYHPLEQDDDPSMYHVYGEYPESPFYFDIEADEERNEFGWCDYSSVSAQFFVDEVLASDEFCSNYLEDDAQCIYPIIDNENSLQLLLAFSRDGEYLETGRLSSENRLDGEGPFRVVVPQKNPGPPDQSVKSAIQDVIWPFDNDADHNAGYASRSATIIKIDPLPEGTTEIDTLEAGWNYVDEKKILIYGAIDPTETVIAKLKELRRQVRDMDKSSFRKRALKRVLVYRITLIERLVKWGYLRPAARQLQRLSWRVNGCADTNSPDKNDWIVRCEQQEQTYWSFYELGILINIK